MQHSSYSAAIRQIFDRINQRESRSQLRLHFVLPIANLQKMREGGRRRRMRREEQEVGFRHSKQASEGKRGRIMSKIQKKKIINMKELEQ